MRSIVGCAALGLVTACASVPRQTKVMSSIPGVEMSTAELRERVYELGRRGSASVEGAVAEILAATDDPGIRRAALAWGLAALPEIQEATLRPEPLVSLGDLWALALQTQTFAREGPGRDAFGETRVVVARAGRDMAREAEQLAALVLGAETFERLRPQLEGWAAENPITSATFARPTASVMWSRALAGEERGALGTLLVGTDERLAELSQRVAMANESLLDRIRWTSALLVQDTLGAEDVADLLEEGAHGVSAEREALFDDVARERAAMFAGIAGERAAVTADAQRLLAEADEKARALTSEVDRTRREVFAEIADERTAITADVDRLLDQADARARALVDRVLVGVGLVGALLIVVAACAVWLVRRASRTRPGKEVGAGMMGARRPG